MKHSTLTRALSLLAACFALSASAHAGVVLSGGGLALVEEGGGIASGNLSATGTAFAKDVLPGYPSHQIPNLNDQLFGNAESWIGNTTGTFAGVSFGATAVQVSSIAFGRDNNNGGLTDRTLGTYTLQYTTQPNPTNATTAWTTIGTLNYQSAGGTNFAFPSKRHRYFFTPVTATGIRLLVPAGGLSAGTCIDELEAYSSIIVANTADSGAGSLRQAILSAAAASGPTHISFAPALSGQTITLGGTQLLITKSLTIDASSLPNGITINANGQSRVMEIQPNSTVALRGLTLTGGMATGDFPANSGGAIFANGAGSGNSVSLSLTSCTLSGNSASRGGGIYSFGSSGSATVNLSSCTLSGNSASSFGGGIFSDGQSNGSATLSLSSCTLSGNSASSQGGGILSSGFSGSATVSLTSCTLSGNSASRGGGIHSEGFAGSATLNLTSCTLSGNSASSQGGGIFSESGEGGIANVSLDNTILAGNTAPDGPDLRKLGTGAISTVGSNLIGDNFGSTITSAPPLVGTAAVPVNPKLSPLGWFGGSIQTMHPLSGSPAVLTSANVTRTDQRGFNLTGPPTIGAVMQGPVITVTDEATLRTALANSANTKGRVIRFNPSLSGKTITLTTDQLLVPSLSDGLFIDASSLPNGITINANGAVTNRRVMEIQLNSTVALHGLTLTGGRANGSFPADSGGAIYANGSGSGNSVRLSLSFCTLSGNSASFLGGGIFITGQSNGLATLNLSSCTLSGNSASVAGGGIYSNGFNQGNAALSLYSCTLSGNSASKGGGIFNNGFNQGSATLSLSSCTLSGNSADLGGGGINSDGSSGSATLSLNNTILTGNTAPDGPDLRTLGTGATTTATGNNLISSLGGQTSLTAGASVTVVADPKLAPLGWFGGSTQTMHPLSGSPAVLTSANVTRTDQRGFALTGPPTIGAVMQGPVITVTDQATLRTALANSANTKGRVIRFNPSLSGQTITLTTGQLLVPGASDGLFIDASSLPSGLTINANGAVTNHRVMQIQPNSSVALHGLTLAGGMASSPFDSGGAIFANGVGSGNLVRLSLSSCTLSGNSAQVGGGIYSDGQSNGSATLSLSSCTLSGNSASGFGGGIFSNGFSQGNATLSLSSCTLSGNSAYSGGGIFSDGRSNGSASLSLNNTILAGNSASWSGPDLFESEAGATTTATGSNLMSSSAGHDAITGGTIILNPNPKLSPLGHYGGPVQTIHPLSGSPAIDAAGTTNPGGTDARGFPRFVDGNAAGGPQLDIGAVEAGTLHTVTTAVDENNGTENLSLREALALSTSPGSRIGFNTSLNGQTITLTGGQFLVPSNTDGLFIDASSLANGLTINANGAVTNHRVMEIQPNSTVALHSLTLTGGRATGTFPANSGGAIYANGSGSGNSVRLSLSSCTLSGNSASDGGGIFSNGRSSGSASLSLSFCTLSGNSASQYGGGIFSDGFFGSATLSLNTSILAGNTAPDGPDLLEFGTGSTTTATGKSLMSSLNGHDSFPTSTPFFRNLIIAEPRLAPLGHYGGLTMTRPPLNNSPAIDGSPINEPGEIIDGSFTNNPGGTDQRGFPRLVDWNNSGGAQLDIGAVEVGPLHTVTTAVDENNGTGNLSLREALALSTSPGSRIGFDTSLNDQTITLTGGQLLVPSNTNGLFIDASSLPNGITIDANGQSRVMQINPNSTVALHGLTLTGGMATGNFPANSGGAIFANGSGSGNSVSLSLYSCTLFGNSAALGGGIYNLSSSPTLTNCSFQGNRASTDGGGVYNNSSSPTLTNCSFQGNSASAWGGGIFNVFSSPILNNCSFQGNRATGYGGGIFNHTSSSPTLTNCSFQGNNAGSPGGGIFNYNSSSPTLNNCIIWKNKDNSGIGTAASSVSNLASSTPSYSHCLIANSGGSSAWNASLGTDGGNNLDTDPLFVLEVDPNTAPTTTGGDLRLRTGSPALNVGNNAANTSTTDLAGTPRIQSGTIDLGAYEGNVITGTLMIDIAPDAAELAGAQWRVFDGANFSPWYLGDGSHVRPPGTYTVHFLPIAGWTTPPNQQVQVTAGATLNLTGTYTPITGTLMIDIAPDAAGLAGAQWRVFDGANFSPWYLGDGSHVRPPGTYTVHFLPIAGWTTPPNQQVQVTAGATLNLTGTYTPATFALLHPSLDPAGDANGNGISNYGDYAAGGNPSAPNDPSLRPKLIGNQLTFSFRNNAADLTREFQKSTTLLSGSWQQLIENTDYTVTTTVSSGGRSLQTLTLTSTLRTTNPKLFFRQEFTSIPPP